jgi:hypothetical protein
VSRVLTRAPAHTLELLVPYQRVALRVIGQAFRDLERPGQAAAARAFLSGSPMLRHWCALAALDAARISATAQVVAARHEARRSHPDGSRASATALRAEPC